MLGLSKYQIFEILLLLVIIWHLRSLFENAGLAKYNLLSKPASADA